MTYENAHNADAIKTEVERIIAAYRRSIRFARQHDLSKKRRAEVEALGLEWALPEDCKNGDAQAVIDAATPKDTTRWHITDGVDYDGVEPTTKLYELMHTPAPIVEEAITDAPSANPLAVPAFAADDEHLAKLVAAFENPRARRVENEKRASMGWQLSAWHDNDMNVVVLLRAIAYRLFANYSEHTQASIQYINTCAFYAMDVDNTGDNLYSLYKRGLLI